MAAQWTKTIVAAVVTTVLAAAGTVRAADPASPPPYTWKKVTSSETTTYLETRMEAYTVPVWKMDATGKPALATETRYREYKAPTQKTVITTRYVRVWRTDPKPPVIAESEVKRQPEAVTPPVQEVKPVPGAETEEKRPQPK